MKINWVFDEFDTKQKVIEEAIVNESLTLTRPQPASPTADDFLGWPSVFGGSGVFLKLLSFPPPSVIGNKPSDMHESIQFWLDEGQESMDKAIQHLQFELSKLRAGKASPSMLEDVRVDYYGTPTPLHQLANVNTPDARTLSVQPWEKSVLAAIERAIINSNLGLNPSNDGHLIRINIPPLTEERRKELVKRAKAEGEHAKVSIRSARRDVNEECKKLQKDGLPEDMIKDAEAKVQQMTDKMIAKVDEVLATKEKEIMTV